MGPKREWRSRAREGRARSRRDRSSSVPRSVQFRVEIGSTAARPGAGATRRAFRCEVGISARVRRRRRRTRAEMSTSTGTRPCAGGSRSPRAPDRSPRTGPTSTAGSYPGSHGRTQIHGVVPDAARSYLKAPLQYDPAPQRTTARIHVRPREPGYDRPEVMAAGPVGRTTTRATAPPHDPPTAPDPTRPITPTPRPRPPTPTASRTARPSDNHHPPPAPSRTTPPHNHDKRTDLEPELNRSRRRRAGSGEPRCQASLTRLSMSSTLFMSRKRDTC